MVLKAIEAHARAGNFDQVEIQARSLLQDLAAAEDAGEQRDLYAEAIPVIRCIPSDAARDDAAAVIEHVKGAQQILGFTAQ